MSNEDWYEPRSAEPPWVKWLFGLVLVIVALALISTIAGALL